MPLFTSSFEFNLCWQAEKLQVAHLNAQLDEFERHTTRTIILHKNVSDLLENVETGISQLVDKMQTGGDKTNEELSFTLVVNIHL